MSLFSNPPSNGIPPSLDIPPTPTSPYNLRKRKAADIIEPTVESPLTKRFRNLNLRPGSGAARITKRTGSPARNTLSNFSNSNNNTSIKEPWSLTPPPFQRPSSPPPAVMDIDDTPHRIYIHDLDSSSDDDDSSHPDSPAKTGKDNPIIFLSDVEREMTRIPMAVLKASSASASSLSSSQVTKLTTARSQSGSSKDLILYRPPEKVADDHGGVKKLIMEAKERMRMRTSSGRMEGIRDNTSQTALSDNMMTDQIMGQLGGGFIGSPMSFIPAIIPNNDPDAMILDDL
ncbi:hypothetical protein ABW20_dc0102159 [Dactylellina cionopaga]|nr:hypothetical protein ABW20_dc0102159 [Dactylellina cionopaga]